MANVARIVVVTLAIAFRVPIVENSNQFRIVTMLGTVSELVRR